MRYFLPLLLASFVTLSAAFSNDDYNFITQSLRPYQSEIKKYLGTLGSDRQGVITPQVDYFGCSICSILIPNAILVLDKYSNDELKALVIKACEHLDLAPKPEICEPIITSYVEQFLYILRNSGNGTHICGILNTGCSDVDSEYTDWRVDVDPYKPEVVPRKWIPPDTQTMKIIQFTDIHLDLDYVEGMTTDCGSGMPICCREPDGFPIGTARPAGKFGDWMCALPMAALSAMIDNAMQHHSDAKYLFLTGDYIHSGVWLYNEEENTRHVKAVAEIFATEFADSDIKIYPLTGNHEANVINMYTPPDLWDIEGFSLLWLYENISEPFMKRDPNLMPQDQLELFKKFGYYSVSPEPGVRIIALNTNVCYMENFWLAHYPKDPYGQLDWLAQQLLRAEIKEEAVLIIGHVQPGSCWPVWSDKFDGIVNRFEGIIRAQFYGHSHRSQFRLNFQKGTTRATSVSFIGGSALTDSMNPAYAVYHVDGVRGLDSTWDVVKQEQMVLDLEKSKDGVAVIEKLTDTAEHFRMEDLRPESIYKFAKSLICDQELLDKYMEYHTKGSNNPAYRHCSIDDHDCLADVLCTIFTSNAGDPGPCDQVKLTIAEDTCWLNRNADGGAVTISSSIAYSTFIGLFTLFILFQ